MVITAIICCNFVRKEARNTLLKGLAQNLIGLRYKKYYSSIIIK